MKKHLHLQRRRRLCVTKWTCQQGVDLSATHTEPREETPEREGYKQLTVAKQHLHLFSTVFLTKFQG